MDYKKTISGSIGAGMGAVFNSSHKSYFILEHRSDTPYHHIGESQPIIVDQIELGRLPSCQVRFDASCETVSRRHAAIIRTQGQWKLISLSQTHSTYVNGTPVKECFLNNGDEIRLSSNGPLMGFIVPGPDMPLSGISGSQRIELFRKQALRPFRTAIIILALIIASLIAALIILGTRYGREKQAQIEENQTNIENIIKADKARINDIRYDIDRKNLEISRLERLLRENSMASESEVDSISRQLDKSRKVQRALEKRLKVLNKEIQEKWTELPKAQNPETVTVENNQEEEQNSKKLDKKIEEIIKSMNDTII